MSDDHNGLEEAQAARRRAEEGLAAMKAKRPEVRELAKRAVRIRQDNGLSDLVVLAFRRAAP